MSSLARTQSRVRDAAAPKRYPVVFASASAPCGARNRWHILTSACPFDGGRHQHYVADLDQASGARRAGCGKGVYWVAVSRVYRVRPVATGAAA